jgi:predicted alpha-1,6-mannanase (GH76 family)
MALPRRLVLLALLFGFQATACSSPETPGPASTEDSGVAAPEAGPWDAGQGDGGKDGGPGPMADADASVPPADGSGGADGSDANSDGNRADAAPDPAVEAMHVRADQALATLMLNFWPNIATNTTTFDWMYAHYWDAVLDATERRGANAFTGTLKMFYELQQQRGWFDNFYDDENWITLALLHSYRVTKDATYLDQAKTVYADIMKAWDTTCCIPGHPGGLYWEKPTTNKVTAINAGAVVSGARLYEDTGDTTYLDFAKQVYGFWSANMVDPTTGHVYDGMDDTGTINTTWSFTYNEGLFIGAVVELAKATGDNSNLPLAHKVASYMMAHEIETTSEGTILSDGKCGGDGEMFKGIGARYLGELYAADPSHTEYRDFLQRSADAAWTLARDPASGNISCDWMGPYDSTTGVQGSMGSAAVGIAAAAEAMGPGAQRPALEYEAEEGDLHGVGLEAKYQGFSGWGYVAGWGSNGQSVDLLVDVPAAGNYQLELRYATGDNAVRSVAVDGTTVSASLSFPSTGGYTTYAAVDLTTSLAAGPHVVTVAYSSPWGTGYVNLDRLKLSAM